MTPERYITPVSAVVAPTWTPLPSGRLIVTEPLRSSDGVAAYARLPYRDALAIAGEMGAELPTREDVLALHEMARALGTELSPVILPTPAICAAHGVEWHDEAGKQRLREQYMMGAEWCQIHDEEVLAQEGDLANNGNPHQAFAPLANVGKLWIAGASPGRARLMGWFLNGAWIQPGLYPPGDIHEAHYAGYADYSSVVALVRPAT